MWKLCAEDVLSFFLGNFHKLCAIPTNSALWDSARNWIYQIFGRINICGEEREMLGCYRWFHLYPELYLRRKKGILRFDKKTVCICKRRSTLNWFLFMKPVSQNPSLQLVIIPMSDQNPNWNSLQLKLRQSLNPYSQKIQRIVHSVPISPTDPISIPTP